jgi:hypothetical protein
MEQDSVMLEEGVSLLALRPERLRLTFRRVDERNGIRDISIPLHEIPERSRDGPAKLERIDGRTFTPAAVTQRAAFDALEDFVLAKIVEDVEKGLFVLAHDARQVEYLLVGTRSDDELGHKALTRRVVCDSNAHHPLLLLNGLRHLVS